MTPTPVQCLLFLVNRGELGENEDFFEKFSSIRISYAAKEKRIQEFQFPCDEVDGELADQLWPTFGGWNVSHFMSYLKI